MTKSELLSLANHFVTEHILRITEQTELIKVCIDNPDVLITATATISIHNKAIDTILDILHKSFADKMSPAEAATAISAIEIKM